MINCANHSMKDADFHCSHCQVGYCHDCVNIKTFDRVKLEVCPTCGNPVTNLTPFKPIEPFWERIPQFLRWPLEGDNWMLLVGWGVFSFFMLGLKAFCTALPFTLYSIVGLILTTLIYYGLLIPYFYRVIGRSEEGDFRVPDFGAFKGLFDSFVLLFRFVMGSLAVFWPMAVFFVGLVVINGGSFGGAAQAMLTPFGIIIFGLAGLAGLALLPMALLIMGVYGHPGMVLNPVYLVQQILKILKEYLIALALMGGLLVLYTGVRLVFYLVMGAIQSLVKYVLFFPIDGALQLYLFMVIGHMLGYLAYQCRYKLKWSPGTEAEPVFMVAGRPTRLEYSRGPGYRLPPPTAPRRPLSPAGGASMPGAAGVSAVGAAAVGAGAAAAPAAAAMGGGIEELAHKINDGMSMLNHGRFEDADVLFQEVLSQSPRNLGALRGMAMTALRLKDLEKAKKYAQQQGAELVRQQAFEPLWDMVIEIKKSIPSFTLTSKEQFALARWLTGQGHDLEAAKALREVAVAYPDDPLSPKALYQCGELLRDRCAKPEAAAQMFDYILKRYPEVAFAEQVRQALGKLKTGA